MDVAEIGHCLRDRVPDFTIMSLLVESALQYAGRGWAVFPCQPRGKAPVTSNGFHAATTDAAYQLMVAQRTRMQHRHCDR